MDNEPAEPYWRKTRRWWKPDTVNLEEQNQMFAAIFLPLIGKAVAWIGATIIAQKLIPAAAEAALSMIPQRRIGIEVTVWGNRLSTRDQLRDIALSIMRTHLSRVPTGSSSDYFAIREDLVNRCVTVEKSVHWNAVQQVISSRDRYSLYPSEKVVLDVFDGDQGADTLCPEIPKNRPDNPAPPNLSGGTTIAQLLTQVLSEPCQLPERPPSKQASANGGWYQLT